MHCTCSSEGQYRMTTSHHALQMRVGDDEEIDKLLTCVPACWRSVDVKTPPLKARHVSCGIAELNSKARLQTFATSPHAFSSRSPLQTGLFPTSLLHWELGHPNCRPPQHLHLPSHHRRPRLPSRVEEVPDIAIRVSRIRESKSACLLTNLV